MSARIHSDEEENQSNIENTPFYYFLTARIAQQNVFKGK